MEDERLSGRLIIDTILANMREQVEELRYSRIVPAAYDVYLHPEDQQRFEGLAHEIAAEAVRALQEKLDALNRTTRLDRVREKVGVSKLPVKKVGPWLVRITRDPEGAVPRGRALVISQIALTGSDHYEGQRTRRLATLSDASGPVPAAPAVAEAIAARVKANREPSPGANAGDAPEGRSTAPAPRGAAALAEPDTRATSDVRTLAVLTWDDQAGSHRFLMTQSEITVGRAAQDPAADVRLATVPDVSRVHLRLRHDPGSRSFSIEDLSLLGTTVNGEALERGSPRPLASPADIRLADAITLRFESGAPA